MVVCFVCSYVSCAPHVIDKIKLPCLEVDKNSIIVSFMTHDNQYAVTVLFMKNVASPVICLQDDQ